MIGTHFLMSSLRSSRNWMKISSQLNKFTYNRPWPTEVACNWNEILRSDIFLFCSSHRPSLSSSSHYWQKTNSRMVVFQPLFIYIRLFRLHVHFFCAARHLKRCKGEQKGHNFLLYFNFFKLLSFFLPFLVVYRLNLFIFFRKKSFFKKILLRAYFAYQANRSFLSILLQFDLNKLPIEWSRALLFVAFSLFSIPRHHLNASYTIFPNK